MKIWTTAILCSALFLFYGFGKTPFTLSSNDVLNMSFELGNTVLSLDTFWIPNSFSPNKDNINDVFKPEINPTYPFDDYSFTVYDRNGRMIFESSEPSASWNGTNQSESGRYFLHNEIFTWHLELTFEGSETTTTRVGLVTLIR